MDEELACVINDSANCGPPNTNVHGTPLRPHPPYIMTANYATRSSRLSTRHTPASAPRLSSVGGWVEWVCEGWRWGGERWGSSAKAISACRLFYSLTGRAGTMGLQTKMVGLILPPTAILSKSSVPGCKGKPLSAQRSVTVHRVLLIQRNVSSGFKFLLPL